VSTERHPGPSAAWPLLGLASSDPGEPPAPAASKMKVAAVGGHA